MGRDGAEGTAIWWPRATPLIYFRRLVGCFCPVRRRHHQKKGYGSWFFIHPEHAIAGAEVLFHRPLPILLKQVMKRYGC